MEAWRGKEIGIAEGKGILLDLKVTAHGRQIKHMYKYLLYDT